MDTNYKYNKKNMLHTTRHTLGAHDTLKFKKNSCKVSYITSLTVIFPIYITWFVTYVIEHTICDCILYSTCNITYVIYDVKKTAGTLLL